jgi:pimeloyl-ACP methyl ester carboxylesterase
VRTVVAVTGLLLLACGGNGDDNPTGPEAPVDEGVTPAAGCTEGVSAHGALYRICFPQSWNGDLVLYAHGYVAPQADLALPGDLVGGQSISGTVTGLGYAYATTSYRANGLVAPDAVSDLVELVDTIEQRYRPDPSRTAIVGFSEGGLVATLAAERHPDRFAGALTGCGPVGDFRGQLNYIDDFRAVFDYFFPGLIPGTAVEVPQSVREQWESVYIPAIVVALAAKPAAAQELLQVTHAPTAGNDLRSIAETTIGLLWYNVFGTPDAQARLGGQPFDNSARVYSGSSNDAALNSGIERFTADPATLSGLAPFETAGTLQVPIVNLHTTGDPIVPFEQAALYAAKLQRTGSSSFFRQIDLDRYGHCSFQMAELLGAFSDLWTRIGNPAATLVAATSLY